MSQLMMTVFKLVGANKAQEDSINAELGALLKLMQNKFKLLFEQIGDLVYKIIFEGPMGDWLISMITAIIVHSAIMSTIIIIIFAVIISIISLNIFMFNIMIIIIRHER